MLHVLQLRCGLVELQHPVAVAVWEGGDAGQLRVDLGAEHHTYWRSAAKPLQLLAALEAMDGAAASENTPFTSRSLSDEELAIAAASHSAEPTHTQLVQQLLARFGLGPSDLRCGAHDPLHSASRDALIAVGRRGTALHNNCSGKHALQLGAARARGWPIESYLDPEHPLQQRVTRTVGRLTGARPALGVDGCGLPTFWLSLGQMARAWSSLAVAMADPDEDPLLARIGWSMARHPELTSGTDRIDLRLARRARQPWVGKIGALGVFCVALPEQGAGVVLKVLSGDEDALAQAVSDVVQRLWPGVLAEPGSDWPHAHVTNVVGRVVGRRLVTGLDRV